MGEEWIVRSFRWLRQTDTCVSLFNTLTSICGEMCLGEGTLLMGGESASLSDCCELFANTPPVDGFGNLKLVNMACGESFPLTPLC